MPALFRSRFLYFWFCAFFFCSHISAQQIATAERYPLVPYPSHLEAQTGSFVITARTTIVSPDFFKNEIEQLQLLVKDELGKTLPVTSSANNGSSIVLQIDAKTNSEEGYQLLVSPNKIVIKTKTGAGAFRAIQTIRQLMPLTASSGAISIPCVTIQDEPLYSWRGMHLDVSRHFFSIDYLKKFIDRMALYKMNTFHLHLTDDQGWRIEIKKYPKLTEEGAWRTFNNQDSECMRRAVDNPDFIIDTSHIIHRDGKTLYGGFYTQEEMKDLIRYASSKHITIVPEIDMPGHMMAAINAYPFLSCSDQNSWGQNFSTPICPCKETTFEFAENVFSEIIDLFPSKYIHLGADEVERSSWAQSSLCKELMQKEGLKNVDELQSYFVKRMEKFFNSKGRELIGWDEILEGGVSPTAVVMYWRSWVPKAPVEAAKHGNKVIMTPGTPLYFDAPPNNHSLEDIYHFSVVPKGLTKEEGSYILGAQANLWTEYVPTENRADYLSMPRMTALAERLWTGERGEEGFSFYQKRLRQQFPRLDAMHIHYRLPDVTGLVEENVFIDSAVLSVKPPLQEMVFHYTTDGTLPNKNSTVLNKPLSITGDATIRLAGFTQSARGDIYTLHYTKQSYQKPVAIS
ncbi:MAG: family 20 glycosylhydrolase, partial [Bacteroidota bacterium]|nr:family 20 glycosylhydrolase [Bacteroidota bacterium]